MNKNSFIAALKMQNFHVNDKQQDRIVLIQDRPLTRINGLHIVIIKNSDGSIIVGVSKLFSPNCDTYHNLNKAYKAVLERM